MLQLLQKLGRRKRAYERRAKTGIILLFSHDRLIGRGELIDESSGGACLRASHSGLANLHYALDPRTAQVAKVRLAWQGAGRIGVEYLSVSNVRGYVEDPAIAHVRAAWRDLAFDYQQVASRGAFSR